MPRTDHHTNTPEDAGRWAAEPDEVPMTPAELADEAALDAALERVRRERAAERRSREAGWE